MTSPKPTLRDRLLGILLVPGCLVALVTLPIWAPIVVWAQARRERQFRQRVSRVGRFIEWTELTPRLERGQGTLIVEQAQKDSARIWWTDCNVVSSSPVAPPAEQDLDYLRLAQPHPFVEWCKARFLDADTGSALLTVPPYRYPPGFIESSFFREKFPHLTVLMTVKDHRGVTPR